MNPDVKQWIIAPEGLDAEMKSEFGDLAAEPESSLALVVLLDQFSRNISRGSPDVFTADANAWETATRAVARGFDKQVTVIQASAFYLSLMQQESVISLIAARCLFEVLKPRCVSPE
ncbi:hypothetical protein AAE478_007124 [Parahypoxylon ruwenzoriense]